MTTDKLAEIMNRSTAKAAWRLCQAMHAAIAIATTLGVTPPDMEEDIQESTLGPIVTLIHNYIAWRNVNFRETAPQAWVRFKEILDEALGEEHLAALDQSVAETLGASHAKPN